MNGSELSDYPSAHRDRAQILLLRRMVLRIVKDELEPPEVYRQRIHRARMTCAIAAIAVVGVLTFQVFGAINGDLATTLAAVGGICVLITLIVVVRAQDKAAQGESADEGLETLSGQLSRLRNDYTGQYDDTDIEDDLALIDALSRYKLAFRTHLLTTVAGIGILGVGYILIVSLVDYL